MLNADRPGRSDALRRRLAVAPLKTSRSPGDGAIVLPRAWPEILLWAFAIFLLTSPFTFWAMQEDPTAAALRDLSSMRSEGGSQWRLYAMRAFVVLLGLGFGITQLRKLPSLAVRVWPLLPFVVWAVLSILWSDVPATSLNSIIALLMLVAAAMTMSLRLSFPMTARALAMSGLVVAVVSVFYVFVLPEYGMHQVRDTSQAIHAGAWRGSYYHKNHLGQTCAVIAVGVILAGSTIMPSRPLKWGIVAALFALIGFSTSASGVVTVPIALGLHWLLIELPAAKRLRALLYIVPATIGGLFLTGQILIAIGRDVTLTGRTEIWDIAWEWFSARPLQGYGFNTLSYGGFTFELLRKRGVVDPHNGYFETALGVGLIGLILFLVLIGYGLVAARRQYAAGGVAREASTVFSGIMLAWLIANLTEVDFRPLSAVGGVGFFALFALLLMPTPRSIAPRSGILR